MYAAAMDKKTEAWPLTQESTAELILAYQMLFELIGKTLYTFPKRSLYEALVSERIFEEFPLVLEDASFLKGRDMLRLWSHSLEGTLSDEEYGRLIVDDTRLFSGFQGIPIAPWESVYFNGERLVFQNETMSVRAWYRKYGLQLARIHHEPDDHIGLETDFVAYLLKCALNCREEDSQKSHELLQDAVTFTEEHPLRWVDRWAQDMRDDAQTALYQGLALILPATLKSFVATFRCAG